MADDIFREVDDDLRAEQQRARARRLVVPAVVLAVLVLIGVGVWQFLVYRQHERALSVAGLYFQAQKDADVTPAAAAGPDAPPTPEQRRAITEFAEVAGRGPAGFASLARLRMAALDWQAKDHAKALALWDQLGHDEAADADLRGLGTLLWVQHSLDDGDPAILKTRLRDILTPKSPWYGLAQEADALVDLRQNHLDEARKKLTALAVDPSLSENGRAVASGLLDTLNATTTPAKTGG